MTPPAWNLLKRRLAPDTDAGTDAGTDAAGQPSRRESWSIWLGRVAVLAAVYALGGAIGLDLAIPPGYATVVWPASGLALAGLLGWGRRHWPAVWLGSFAINAYHALGGSAGEISIGHALLNGTVFGAGASLQAVVAASAARRWFVSGIDLGTPRRLAAFLGAVLLAPCLISASVGTVMLALGTGIDLTLALRNWYTWYGGDVLGISAVLPTLLFSPISPVPLRWRGRVLRGVTALVAICLALATGATFVLWKHSVEQQYGRAQASFFAITTETERALDRRFEIYSQALGAAAGLLAVDPAMTERRWEAYVGATGLEQHLPGLLGIGTIEAMSSSDLDRLVREMERAGDPPLDVHPLTGRDWHYVVTLVAPFERNKRIYGLDLGFDPNRRAAMARARRIGQTVLTPQIGLLQKDRPSPGYLLLLPLGARPHGHDEKVPGFRWAYAPIEIDHIFAGLTTGQGQDFTLEVFEGDTTDPARRIYATGAGTEDAADPLFRRTARVTVSGRQWTLRWASLEPFETRAMSNEPLSVLLGGGLVTVLLGLLLSHFVRREATISREVDMATGELARVAEERRLAVEDLNESNRLLLLAEATMHVGHWQLDFVTGQVLWSDELFHIHGLPPGPSPSPAEVLEFYVPEDRAIVVAAIDAARKYGAPCRFAACVRRADGALRHVEIVAHVEPAEDGSPGGLFGVLADRTEEVELRNELLRTRDEARAAADAKSAFLANMSHDIRTPMNAVLGFAEMLHGADLPLEQHRQVGIILDSGRNMMSLLNDILDLSKIEAGRMELVERSFDVHALLGGAIELFRQSAAERGIALGLDLDPAVPQWIRGDKVRIRQILDNLLSNAVKFTGKGQVMLAARVQRGKGAARLAISVSDTGIGIAADRQQHIFDGFTQADASIHERFGGTGLGLAICARLAALMGGTVAVESVTGHGSTFTLRLPLRPARARTEGVEEAAWGEEPDRPLALAGRVLVAEDNHINRMVVAAMLDRLGIDHVFAGDGEEAIAAVKAARAAGEPFAMVLMDIQMPRMGGHDAARALRRAGIDAEELPIVGLSANAFPEDTVAALEAGMQAHLTKPLRLEALAAVLAEFAGEPEGGGETDPGQAD